MYCIKRITDDLTWVGGDDRRLSMFEGVYSVPNGVSYNSYLLMDKSTVLFDTVDQAIDKVFYENVEQVLAGRKLDYIVVSHVEPDHSATLSGVLMRHPESKVICNKKSEAMLEQFFTISFEKFVVDETTVLDTGRHKITFIMAPMVHWPEVMVSFDAADGVLFSADAFGHFGALGGAIFADEVDFMHDYLGEARRYYSNIVGKYGNQVQALLKKVANLGINMICPLHGYVWRGNLTDIIFKYQQWSSYTPEESGVLIAYASVYGNTKNAAEIISCRLREKGLKTVLFDVSVTSASDIISQSFRFSHMLFLSTTYNAGVFVKMEDLLRDLAAHNIQNRTVAFVENGSWAPTSGKLMKEIFSGCKNLTWIESSLTIKSSLKIEQMEKVESLVNEIAKSVAAESVEATRQPPSDNIEAPAMFNFSYGLFVLTAKDGEKDNGCIINTAMQITCDPTRIAIAVDKSNFTHNMIIKTGRFNISILSEDAPFTIVKRFGFATGRNTEKFNHEKIERTQNGVAYISGYTNSVISAKVFEKKEYPTHTLFVADVEEAKVLSKKPSLTYAYYLAHTKPKPQPAESKGRVWICRICGYIYDEDKEGIPFEQLPDNYVCPLCKHPKADFELQK